MINRLNQDLSKPYLQFLNDINLSSTKSSPSFPQFQTFTPVSSKTKHTGNDRKFFELLPNLLDDFDKDAPQLRQAASEVLADPHGNLIAAYNKDTYIEYHQVLCELLRRFIDSLESLQKFDNAGPMESESFNLYVGRVGLAGDALQRMVGGQIIEVHMKVITTALNKSSRATLDTNQEPEWDEELYRIGSALPMWEAYCEWLRLMVVHFDAVRILITHLSKASFPEVTIKVITAPPPDNTLLPWKELLQNERYFDNGITGSTSTNDIITFLETWLDRQTPQRSSVHVNTVFEDFLKLHSEGTIKEKVDEIIQDLDFMGSCQSPGSEDIVNYLSSTLQSLKDASGEPAPKLISEISDAFRSLRDRALLFTMLKNPLFKGTLHCELTLACFIMPSEIPLAKGYEPIVDELSVSCIVSTLILSFLYPI
jgi:hypothetical protein